MVFGSIVIYCFDFLFNSPIINEKVEDRICGWGPTLEFYLNNDQFLENQKQTVFNLLKQNYDAAWAYVISYEHLRLFYSEDLKINQEDIKNETGNYLL